ncbi:MAG: DnaJ domain-containing protein [Candidatus Thermoplasmatota archaeon]|nr:DnaJ domain-containing protein [Candidatus Thermoplasmatota archaeon]
MYDRSARGAKFHLIALTLWVASAALVPAILYMADSFVGVLLGFIILLTVLAGMYLFIAGSVYLVRGRKEAGNHFQMIAFVILLMLSLLVITAGFLSNGAFNYIIVGIGLWMFFASLVLPHIKLGRWVAGSISLLILTVMFSYYLLIMLTNSTSINMPIFLSLFGSYFLFLDASVLISFMSIRKMQARTELTEGEESKDIGPFKGVDDPEWIERELRSGRSGKLKFGAAQSDQRSPVPATDFKVLEYEFPGTSESASGSADTDSFREIPSVESRWTAVPKRTPVTGRALRFEEAVRRMEAAEAGRKAREAGDRFTIEEEEDIDLSWEDLFIDGMNMYEVLHVPREASSMEIRKAYRKMALLHHPDKFRDGSRADAEASAAEMVRINTAKQILLDPARRGLYDRMLDNVH